MTSFGPMDERALWDEIESAVGSRPALEALQAGLDDADQAPVPEPTRVVMLGRIQQYLDDMDMADKGVR